MMTMWWRAKLAAEAAQIPPSSVGGQVPAQPKISSFGACLSALYSVMSEALQISEFILEHQSKAAKYEELKKRVSEGNEKLERTTADLAAVVEERDEHRKSLTKANDEKKDMKASLKQSKSEVAEPKKKVGPLWEKVPQLEAQVTQLKDQVAECESRARRLEEEKDSLENEAADHYVAGYHLSLEHVEVVYAVPSWIWAALGHSVMW